MHSELSLFVEHHGPAIELRGCFLASTRPSHGMQRIDQFRARSEIRRSEQSRCGEAGVGEGERFVPDGLVRFEIMFTTRRLTMTTWPDSVTRAIQESGTLCRLSQPQAREDVSETHAQN